MRLQMRGIGPAIIRQYLVDLGGVETEGGTVVGHGWSAKVEAGAPIHIRAIRLGQTIVTFAGDDQAVEEVAAALKDKAIRAGG